MIFQIIVLFLLLCASAFFSGSETAFFSLSSIKLRKFQYEKKGKAALVAKLLSRPRNLLISILIGNMIVNVFSSSIAASFFRKIIPTSASDYISIGVMTFLILIFGEITPKTFAIHNSERLSLFVSPIVNGFSKIVAPARSLLWWITDGIIYLLGGKKTVQEPSITEGELKTALKIGLREGILDTQEKNMIHGVFDFGAKQVRDMMKSRIEIFAFEIGTPFIEMAKKIQQRDYTRIPVYEGDIDNVIGILYAKDLLYLRDKDVNTINVKDILRPAYYVPETMPVDELLQEFRNRRTHFALVVDEYGSLSGLITLEDVLEVIVGRLDVKKDEIELYSFIDDNTIRVSGLLGIDEFNELFSSSLHDRYAVTIGGFLSHQMGRIPIAGETYKFGNLVFEVIKAEKNRIEEITVRRKLK